MIEDAARNAVIGQVVLILAGLAGGFLGFLVSLFGFGAYALGMNGFAEVFGDSRIFRFVVFAVVTSLAAALILLAGSAKAGLVLLAVAYLFEILANYYLYRASGVPAVIWGYGLILLGLPLLLVYIGVLLIIAGRVMVIYGYYSIPEMYRIKRKARRHMGMAL
ncbi:hypothetical protein [Thermococcus thioreducens]|uniref:Uncharacterized protein n=1 Tax=Thermococcus thioreducens TaxID=277988 RepID=A0A0Q2M1J4_9EURY|nr:hypothetical protein [Thermococcus thioreducens]ASJ11461.1 hypothetical protein A3L14_00525 [Thermococcus thioreducens]KQH81921.1 hypothetical protein AMR53_09300 [Thermococcus thioreducens]SEW06296.1 hypothetical protein SAMN05216170_1332 [Thermococcus thioreducens]